VCVCRMYCVCALRDIAHVLGGRRVNALCVGWLKKQMRDALGVYSSAHANIGERVGRKKNAGVHKSSMKDSDMPAADAEGPLYIADWHVMSGEASSASVQLFNFLEFQLVAFFSNRTPTVYMFPLRLSPNLRLTTSVFRKIQSPAISTPNFVTQSRPKSMLKSQTLNC